MISPNSQNVYGRVSLGLDEDSIIDINEQFKSGSSYVYLVTSPTAFRMQDIEVSWSSEADTAGPEIRNIKFYYMSHILERYER